jgi:hypothetical protein
VFTQYVDRARHMQRDKSHPEPIPDLTYAGDMSDPQSNVRFHNARR